MKTDKIVKTIVKEFDPIAIVDYDLGLLIVLNTNISSRASREAIISNALGKKYAAVELDVYTPEELKRALRSEESAAEYKLRRGEVLYGSIDEFRQMLRS